MVAPERKRECHFFHHPATICVLKTRKFTRWYESDVPWGHLDEGGETETMARTTREFYSISLGF
jgi:hypothetical protein